VPRLNPPAEFRGRR